MRRHQNRRGFTIIEVMLFLAITGLMIVGVMAGVGGSINRQRYQDATTSVLDFFQGQYNTVDNVYSNRPAYISCSEGSLEEGIEQARGTSDCSIIGRYITTSDGRKLMSQPLLAQNDIAAIDTSQEMTEVEYIQALGLARTGDVFNNDNDEFTSPWETTLYTDPESPSTADAFTVVLIKMPNSGLIRAFTIKKADATINEVIEASTSDDFLVCVNPAGLVASPSYGVKIKPLSVNASGVQPTQGGDC
jgi:type II secretory pathway pseudopilin PulG